MILRRSLQASESKYGGIAFKRRLVFHIGRISSEDTISSTILLCTPILEKITPFRYANLFHVFKFVTISSRLRQDVSFCNEWHLDPEKFALLIIRFRCSTSSPRECSCQVKIETQA